MLTATEIEANKNKYCNLFKDLIIPEYGDSARALLEWIAQTDFFEAPASTRYHNSFKGGLCDHSLNVYNRLIKNLEAEYGKDFCKNEIYQSECRLNLGGLALIALCHDLCKCQYYEIAYRNEKEYRSNGSKHDEKGNFEWVVKEYYTTNPKFNFGHGSKSVFLVQNFITGISLDEALPIRFHMMGREYPGRDFSEDEAFSSMNEFPLVLFLATADLQATYLDERQLKE